MAAVLLAGLLLLAGRSDWSAAYPAAALYSFALIAFNARLQRQHPTLFSRRAQSGAGVPQTDRLLTPLMKLSVLATFGVAAWDAGGSARSPAIGELVCGLVVFAAGWTALDWGARSNPYFEGMVRHQPEHGQVVVQSGPYRRVRHPGYSGFLLLFGAAPLLLASTWAWVPWSCFAVLTLLRIQVEETLLRGSLPGYADYCRQVRCRLLPWLF